MSNLLKIFDADNYPDIPSPKDFTYSYSAPGMIRVLGNVEGDTFQLDSGTSRWEVRFGGRMFTLDWNHPSLLGVDKTLVSLWRHHLTEEAQTKSPPTVHHKFNAFCRCAKELSSDLSLRSLLSVFHRTYANRDDGFYYLRAFYNWGIRKEIQLFDRRVQNIINDLPAPHNNAYESIFFQQNYITPKQETRILKHIDLCLSEVESLSDGEFDIELYIKLRDACLLLLVFEIAPRPLQVYMFQYEDLKSTKIEEDAYYSIRLRRNKNRHRSETYTSPREISVRLGSALEKLNKLNQQLLKQPDRKRAPFFLSGTGKRLGTQAISNVVSTFLATIFGEDKLDVDGALIPFRHHLGQSLADQGAPPPVIADRLGHSTEVAARAYITATPNIAKIKTRALGENATYKGLMDALLTGSIQHREEINDPSSLVRGTVAMRYIEGIGACDAKGYCHSDPVYACYTCRKFHPFVDGPHDRVVDALKEQVATFLDSTPDLQHSRPAIQLEIAIESAKAILKECKKHAGRE